MEVKNLCDPSVKQDILNRINKLTPETQHQWGKMDVAQMMAHCQVPLAVAEGKQKPKRTMMGIIFGPFVKKILYGEKPFKKNLPTDPSFVMTDPKEFAKEKVALLESVKQFSEENISGEKHPFFGRLTKEQWSKGMYKHLDHHLQQFGV